jgi:invasion protein IalB
MTFKPCIASALAISIVLGGPAIAQLSPPEPGAGPAIGAFPDAADEGSAQEDAPESDAEAPADEADDEADDAEADDAEAAPATADDADPSDQEAVAPDTDLPVPEIYEVVRDTFDDWEVRCAPDGDDCFLYQLALDEDENPVAEFSLVRLPEGSEAVAAATVVTPLGTLLPAGLVVQINGGEARQYPFTFCSQVGCFAQLAFTQETISAMRRGRVAQLTLASVAAPSDPVELEVSLIGFTAAFNSLAVGE